MPKKRENYEKSVYYRLKQWIYSYSEPFEQPRPMGNAPKTADEAKAAPPDAETLMEMPEVRSFKTAYRIASVIVCLTLIAVLLITISYLPRYGDPDNPHNTSFTAYERGCFRPTVNITAG